jgi:hypothetical protein
MQAAEADRRLNQQMAMQAQLVAEANKRFEDLTSNVFARDDARARASEAKAEAAEAAEARASEAKARAAEETVEVVVGAVALPKLDSVRVADPSLRCGDWLKRVALAISAFSPNADVWWESTIEASQKAYLAWMATDALERSYTKVEVAPWPKYKQLSITVSTKILEAVRPEIGNDAMHDNDLAPAALIFRILKAYQPGGVEERVKIINELSATKAMTTAGAAVAELRRWERMRSRAVELRITIPDPYVQWQSVLRVVERVVNSDKSLEYRMMVARTAARVDVVPCDSGVLSMTRLYIAELSQRALLDDVNPTTSGASVVSNASDGEVQDWVGETPEENAGEGENPGEEQEETWEEPEETWGLQDETWLGEHNARGARLHNHKTPCKDYLHGGCKKGGSCEFFHNYLHFSPEDENCRNCGEWGHWGRECPYPGRQPAGAAAVTAQGSGNDEDEDEDDSEDDEEESEAEAAKELRSGSRTLLGRCFHGFGETRGDEQRRRE